MTLSVIVLNWNTKQITLNCLRSIFIETKNLDFEVILVDNGSTDGSIEAIKSAFPQVKRIENKENMGFGKGNNQGVGIASGKYILFLNSDTIILDNALEKVVHYLDTHENVGAASCKLLNDDKTIQPTGGFFPTISKVIAWMFFIDDLPVFRNKIGPYHYRNQNMPVNESDLFAKEHEQDWVTGAFLMVRKEILDKVGLFDDKYFMYFEEVELCFRIKKMGWKITVTPIAKIVHLGQKSSKSSSVGSPTGLLGEYRGIIEFYKKYYPGKLFLARIALKLGALLRIGLWGIIKRQKDACQIYEEAFNLA